MHPTFFKFSLSVNLVSSLNREGCFVFVFPDSAAGFFFVLFCFVCLLLLFFVCLFVCFGGVRITRICDLVGVFNPVIYKGC